MVNNTDPFNLPVFEQLLRTAFFSKPRSFGYRLLPHFTSSLPEAPDEKEIPVPMLALITTAVCTFPILSTALEYDRNEGTDHRHDTAVRID